MHDVRSVKTMRKSIVKNVVDGMMAILRLVVVAVLTYTPCSGAEVDLGLFPLAGGLPAGFTFSKQVSGIKGIIGS